jgi:hypothetical protein
MSRRSKNPPIDDPIENAMNALIKKFESMWKLRKELRVQKEFETLTDKKKQAHFDQHGYEDMNKDHPIVSRYLICMGLYNTKAFKRYLLKIKNTPHLEESKRDKKYMEEQWVRRQADYVRYLWEAYEGNHYNNSQAQSVWQDAYTKLKGEFDDFRDLHKNVETKIAQDRIKFDASNLDELVARIKSGQQTLPKAELYNLLFNLKNKASRRLYSNCMNEIIQCVEPTPYSCEGIGCGEATPVQDPNKPKITMIETVDENRLNEVPAEYTQPITDDNIKKMMNA